MRFWSSLERLCNWNSDKIGSTCCYWAHRLNITVHAPTPHCFMLHLCSFALPLQTPQNFKNLRASNSALVSNDSHSLNWYPTVSWTSHPSPRTLDLPRPLTDTQTQITMLRHYTQLPFPNYWALITSTPVFMLLSCYSFSLSYHHTLRPFPRNWFSMYYSRYPSSLFLSSLSFCLYLRLYYWSWRLPVHIPAVPYIEKE